MLDTWIRILTRGTLVLGPLFLLFWVLKPNILKKYRIPQVKNVETRHLRDLIQTIFGLSVYVIPFFLLGVAKEKLGLFNVYTNIADYGWFYFFFSIFLFMFINDTWFYWTHFGMHKISVLKLAHKEHHKSANTTPLTSYSFSVFEALLDMLFYIPMIIFLPWHPLALSIYGLIGILHNGYIHLGYDFFFKYRSQHPILKWHNTSTHHSIHHQLYEGNYSVWFTFWDKLMKTEVIDSRIAKLD